jgi:hypothetical protein
MSITVTPLHSDVSVVVEGLPTGLQVIDRVVAALEAEGHDDTAAAFLTYAYQCATDCEVLQLARRTVDLVEVN